MEGGGQGGNAGERRESTKSTNRNGEGDRESQRVHSSSRCRLQRDCLVQEDAFLCLLRAARVLEPARDLGAAQAQLDRRRLPLLTAVVSALALAPVDKHRNAREGSATGAAGAAVEREEEVRTGHGEFRVPFFCRSIVCLALPNKGSRTANLFGGDHAIFKTRPTPFGHAPP
jgi:hypothetical protein